MPSTTRTLPALLAARAAAQPDRVAIETPLVARLTFRAWHAGSAAVAGALHEGGLRPGDRVVLHFGSRDWADFAVAYCGVQRAGGVAVPSSDRLAPAETRYIVRHCGAVAVLHAGRTPVPDLGVWSATVPELRAAGAPPPTVRVRPDDLAQILYTSGTTGRPKGVAASHANLTAGAVTDPRRRRLRHSAHFLHAFPIGTNAAQTMLWNALDAHPTALSPPQFTPGRFARLAEQYRVGTLFVVPAMAIELLNSGALDAYDLSAVHLLGSTAAPLPPWVAEQLARRLPEATIVNYYTSTEAAPAQVSMIVDPARPGSVGRAADGTIAIRDASGRRLPAGATGEVWLRSPYPRSYYRDAAATRQTFRAGWVRMGDLGYLDEQGYLYLVDREQDVIKSGADKVSTIQVEAALHAHPDIAEAAVLGVPHPVLGRAVAAALVPRAGTNGPDLPQLRRFLLDRLARHELPTEVLVLDRLPRNPAGKVVKRELLDRFTRARPAPDRGAADPAGEKSGEKYDDEVRDVGAPVPAVWKE
ncbi:class I adenylate-forming enzyme family protein [Micromonospora sp. HM5-17]|uniref:class I adenylate-forming enzyme family protein n=1 Tax=Micromonospora sp. HM5-17 TaxID=2487710 RepID=UPI001F1D16A9|nr:AMP-binding protein [Micromonospora sp. HM5-17]